MPDKATKQRAARAKRAGKSASTQAGEFVRGEIERIRKGKHGAKNAKQAIAIGLSEARRAGVPVKGKGGKAAGPTRKAKPGPKSKTSQRRSAAATKALKKQPRRAASHLALSRQAHSVARSRTKADRSAAARKAAKTRARSRASR